MTDQNSSENMDTESLNENAVLSSENLTFDLTNNSVNGGEENNAATLYVAIQPPPNGGNNGEMTEEQPAVFVEVVEASDISAQMNTHNSNDQGNNEMIMTEQGASGDGDTMTIHPTSLVTQVVDQATLSTMQAEMIAVQVLSQSATGDVQFFPTTQNDAQVIPVTSCINAADLQASLVAAQSVAASSNITFSDQSNSEHINQTTVTTVDDDPNASCPQPPDGVTIVNTMPVPEDAEPGDDSKPKYICEICGKCYLRSWSYYGHMREHASGEKNHKCDVCEKVFNYASNLRQHMLIHTGEKPFECEICDKAFNNPSSLRSHLMSHSEERPYICDQEGCTKAFNNPGSLRVHRRVHQEEKPYSCTQDNCDKAFKTPAELSRHMFRHTGEKPHKCDQCEKAFIRYDDLKRHYRIHTGEKPFKCDICDFACIQSFDLVKHKYTHSGDKPYKCDLCTKQFTRPARLRDHLRIHSGEKPFSCNVCGKAFSVQTGLKSHMAVHTGDKPFKCGECERSFRTQQELQAHMGRHTGIKPFKCNICNKEFISAVTFKRHAIVHSGEKPFQCDECGRRFARSTDLKVHLPVHSDDKPYKCGECEKMFTRFSTLKEHIRTHTGERPFKCNDCGRQFNHRSHFNNHLRIHTGEKPFKCEKCGKLFSRKASVRYHMKVHGIDASNATVATNDNNQQNITSVIDPEQVTAGQIINQLTHQSDVQLAEVLVAVSDALVAANQSGQVVVDNQDHGDEMMENNGEQQTIETDMNADQVITTTSTGNNQDNQIIPQVIDASGQLTDAQIMEVSGITSVETSQGHVITVNVSEDGHVMDANQIEALNVIAEAAKNNHIHIAADLLAAASVSSLNTAQDTSHMEEVVSAGPMTTSSDGTVITTADEAVPTTSGDIIHDMVTEQQVMHITT